MKQQQTKQFTAVGEIITKTNIVWTIVCDALPVDGVCKAQLLVASHQDWAINNAGQRMKRK